MKLPTFLPCPLLFLAAAIHLADPALHASAPTAPAPMAVMTFNVRLAIASDGPNAWTHRCDLLVKVVQEFDPVVLGVQEALQPQLDFITDSLPHRVSIGEARDGGGDGEYSAIVYDRRRIQALQSGTFWLSDTPDEPSMSWGNKYRRICTWARFRDRASGACFQIFNTHLDHESENARLRGVRLILERIRDRAHGSEPFLLMGDFNADEASEPVRLITRPAGSGSGESLPPMVDTFRVLHPDTTDVGTFHGFTGRDDGRKIDHIFAPREAEVLSAGIIRTSRDGRFPSDHHPVTAVVRFK